MASPFDIIHAATVRREMAEFFEAEEEEVSPETPAQALRREQRDATPNNTRQRTRTRHS